MGYNGSTPTVFQPNSWSCSIATATWVLRSIGIDENVWNMQQQMVPDLVTSSLGLLDGSGRSVSRWLENAYGVDVQVESDASFQWVLDRAGNGPIGMGGHSWYHWVGVRGCDDDVLLLANPAPGYLGVYQTLTRDQWRRLGPFSAYWLPQEEAEDPVKIAELEAQLGDAKQWGDAILGEVGNWADLLDQARANEEWDRVAEIAATMRRNANGE